MNEYIRPANMKSFSLYSPAVRSGNVIYVAGQLPINSRGEVEGSDIVAQTRQVLENIKRVLAAAGASLSDVVRTTVYLTDIKDFQRMNQVYGEYFEEGKLPARTTIQVASLASKASVIEIDAIAVTSQ